MVEHKDRLFCFIFGSEEHKDWTLNLYNMFSGAEYKDPSLLTFTTISQVLYLGMHNDVSFLIKDELNLLEQQSTYNPNMPLRMMQYVGNIYETMITMRKENKFGSTLIKLPVPKLITLYNGEKNQKKEVVLNLSDAFPKSKRDTSDIQVRVRMININSGFNKKMVQNCKPLNEYVWTVSQIREYKKTMEVEAAIEKVLTEMPEDFLIRPYLLANRVGVKKMLLTEYNEQETMKLFERDGMKKGERKGRKEGRIEGRKEGRIEGRKEGRIEGRKEGIVEGRIEGRKEGIAEGRKEGRADGARMVTQLIANLLNVGRDGDIKKVTENEAYRDQLLVEFGLMPSPV